MLTSRSPLPTWASTTTALGADICTYALSKSAFIAAALDYSSIMLKTDWNEAFYGAALDTAGVVGDAALILQGAHGLRQSLAQ